MFSSFVIFFFFPWRKKVTHVIAEVECLLLDLMEVFWLVQLTLSDIENILLQVL